MSFILDALRKSETDRQQKASPGIADVPMAKSGDRAPRWQPVVIGLLAVNLAAVLFLLLRPDPEPSVAAEPVSLARVAEEPAPATAAPARSMPAPPVATETAQPVIPTAAATAPADNPAAAPAETPLSDESGNLPGREPMTAGAAGDETYLTLNDLRASGNVNLPDMHIDLHVYSDNPGERFVFINMNQYREKATLAEGPRLRRITPEGVILDYRGSTFLLPRE